MKHIETDITIKASPEKVWNILTNFENIASWNPFIRSLTGKAEVGNTISVVLKPPNGKTMTFKPEVLVFDANREFRWKGKLWFKGLFDGEHYFILEEIEGGTRFIHGENFAGIFVSLLSSVLKDTETGFQQMNIALKEKSET